MQYTKSGQVNFYLDKLNLGLLVLTGGQVKSNSWGLFTMNDSVCDCDIINKWVPLTSTALFTFSDGKQ